MRAERLVSFLCLAWFTVGPAVVGAGLSAWVVRGGAEVLPPLPALVVGITLLLGLALVPTTLVALLGGYLAGMESLWFTVATYLPAAALGYVIGRLFRPAWLLAWLERRPGFDNTLTRLKQGGWKTVFWVRLSPVVPFGIGNLTMAWAGMPLRAVLLGSLPGMLPRTILATYAGTQARSLAEAVHGNQSPWSLAGTVVLLLAAGIGLWAQGRIRR